VPGVIELSRIRVRAALHTLQTSASRGCHQRLQAGRRSAYTPLPATSQIACHPSTPGFAITHAMDRPSA